MHALTARRDTLEKEHEETASVRTKLKQQTLLKGIPSNQIVMLRVFLINSEWS